MSSVLNDDCWRLIFSFLHDDRNTLFQSLLVSRALFRSAVPILYRRPLIEFEHNTLQSCRRDLEDLLLSQAIHSGQCVQSPPLALDSTQPKSPCPLDTESKESTFGIVNYYSFVKNMPDCPVGYPIISQTNTRFHSTKDNGDIDHNGDVQLQYMKIFASKIQSVVLGVQKQSMMETLLPALNNLTEMKINLDGASKRQLLEGATRAITIHRQAFPGKLKKVSFLQSSTTEQNVCDAEVVMAIRNAMSCEADSMDVSENKKNGRLWGIDEVKLIIPVEGSDGEQDEKQLSDLFAVLQDVDLPKELRFLSVIANGEGPIQSRWVEPLSIFLSRCRNLNMVNIQGCPPEIFTWAVDQSGSSPLSSTLRESLVNWKKVEVVSHDLPYEELSILWRKLIKGFSHCMETFGFFDASDVLDDFDPSHLEMRSILDSDLLPHLETLVIACPRFGGFSPLATPKLRKLSFFISHDEVYGEVDETGKGSIGHGRIFPESIVDLNLYDRSLFIHGFMPLVKGLQKLESLNVYQCPTSKYRLPDEQDLDVKAAEKNLDQKQLLGIDFGLGCDSDSCKSVDHNSNTSDCRCKHWIWPRLKEVRLQGHSANFLNLNILLIAPNISHLILDESSHVGPIDATEFFDLAASRSFKFSTLQILYVREVLKLDPAHLGLLLGFPQVNGSGCADGDCDHHGHNQYQQRHLKRNLMFPLLEGVSVGKIKSGREEEGVEKFMHVIQEGVSALDSTGDNRTMKFEVIDHEGWAKWKKWLESEEMGLSSTKDEKADGFMLQCGPYWDKKIYFRNK